MTRGSRKIEREKRIDQKINEVKKFFCKMYNQDTCTLFKDTVRFTNFANQIAL